MKFEIKNRWNGNIIFTVEAASWSLAVSLAINSNVDLSSADLSNVDLSSADLSSADLRYANLSNANLSNADLSNANLRYADLSSADLSNVDLRYANLSNADLSNANLRYANLKYADLSNANLRYADLVTFQFQRHTAHYTLDGSLRVGCICLPIVEWKQTFEQIGIKEGYTFEQIGMYGMFIDMCYNKFMSDTKERK